MLKSCLVKVSNSFCINRNILHDQSVYFQQYPAQLHFTLKLTHVSLIIKHISWELLQYYFLQYTMHLLITSFTLIQLLLDTGELAELKVQSDYPGLYGLFQLRIPLLIMIKFWVSSPETWSFTIIV